MNIHEKINYIELPSSDIDKTRAFFSQVFDWQFTDYGAEYIAFSAAGIDGGFYLSELHVSTDNGSALIVFYSNFIHKTLDKIVAAGGEIIKPIYAFPGGSRFHFTDLTNNEFAVWTTAAP